MSKKDTRFIASGQMATPPARSISSSRTDKLSKVTSFYLGKACSSGILMTG
jgi:hypothetical protein